MEGGKILAHTWRVIPGGLSWGDCRFVWGERTYVMGILNVTPDSFSDGGRYLNTSEAVAHALQMEAAGADVIDLGAESTRPGAAPIPVEEELQRLLPVLRELVPRLRVPISVDTYKAEVARIALQEGAALINDVGGLHRDPAMAQVAAAFRVPIIVMHSRPHGDTHYDDFWGDILGFLERGIQRARAAGLPADMVIVDPGFGFGKNTAQNLELMRQLHRLRRLGRPVLLGTSRKRSIGEVLDLPVDQRVEGTAATVALAVAHGVDIVRVHDVEPMVRLVRMTDAIVRHPHWQPPGTDGFAPQPGSDGEASATVRRAGTAVARMAPADTVQLRGLRFWARHGVYPEERQKEQLFVVDVDLGLNTRPAAQRDALEATVDYAAVHRRIAQVVTGLHRQLLETLADRIARELLEAFAVQFVRVRVAKPLAPLPGPADHAAVEVWRSRDSQGSWQG